MEDEGEMVLAVVAFALARYALLAGLSYALCYRPGLRSLQRFKIQPKQPSARHIQHELLYSSSTACIFSLLGVVVYWLFTHGYTTLYTDIALQGWAYFGASFLLVLVFHDAYFYWSHRLLHTRWLYRHVHIVHHHSTNPTPWAAYSFHPVEALLEGAVVFPIILILPVHVYVFGCFLVLVLAANIVGHLGYEFLPEGVRRSLLGKHLTSSTHHNLHHQLFNKNYGYYFTHWDIWMKTGQDKRPRKR
ncbi:sterol desaturase family protein [Hymenobacter jejuensis]|uniref:Sterol desaturase family protein n=1 Tax=Hymenobacter jejuensis TaxID=2502781 RepID=A0A5B8A3X2_9BACT|nr:sterol desaturase family protein [Hymenobacter jejuensis]QDA62040.1 sterol desaturase family protein [Hymenobacter jejuensis]